MKLNDTLPPPTHPPIQYVLLERLAKISDKLTTQHSFFPLWDVIFLLSNFQSFENDTYSVFICEYVNAAVYLLRHFHNILTEIPNVWVELRYHLTIFVLDFHWIEH